MHARTIARYTTRCVTIMVSTECQVRLGQREGGGGRHHAPAIGCIDGMQRDDSQSHYPQSHMTRQASDLAVTLWGRWGCIDDHRSAARGGTRCCLVLQPTDRQPLAGHLAGVEQAVTWGLETEGRGCIRHPDPRLQVQNGLCRSSSWLVIDIIDWLQSLY
jgi:hypothetical protein